MIIVSHLRITMNSINSSLPAPKSRLTSKGFSLVEVLVLMGAIATTTGIGVVAVQHTREAAQEHKLESDVGRLNTAVRAYLLNGGSLPADADGSSVLARLKSKPTSGAAKALVGVGGPFIDERISGVAASGTGTVRATWNATSQRFALATTGAGYSAFTLNGPILTTVGTETRSTAQKFASQDAWVWDYDSTEKVTVADKPDDAATGAPDLIAFTPQGRPGPRVLVQPEYSIPAGLYPYAKFPMQVTLNNPNPAGSSRLFYSLNNGGWLPYTEGERLSLPIETLDSTLRTYAAANNSEAWNDSSSTENIYKTIFFRGGTAGVFHDPIGTSAMVTNLTKGKTDPTFTWGKIASGYKKSNSMTFTPAANYTVVPDQEFKIGDLYYYNGTVVSGTSSTGVKLRVGLNFTVPSRTEQFEFDFRLFSTVNNNVDADADADFVWIPTLASQLTAQVQGQTFYLQLRFGNSSTNGFTTIDEFHVHENKSATGAIYGKFTTNPVF